MLVCHALNQLPHPQELAEGQPWAEKCCPDCCAPCGLLRDLDDDGTLDTIVRKAPAGVWGDGWAWWSDEGGVDKDWLYASWGCTSQPKCLRAAMYERLDHLRTLARKRTTEYGQAQ